MVRPIRWFGPVPEGTMLRAWISVAAEANNRVWRIYVEPFEFRPRGSERLYLVRVDEDDLRLGLTLSAALCSEGTGFRFTV